MGKFIVMDIVFYGGSLNYDQGVGNYQELKKITKWDGRQYTLVSRYAMRYSLLETAMRMGLWEVADADKLQRAGKGDKTVIQPSTELLVSGEILDYPEFDFFGYLITTTTPQNFRVAPVKISHAISMTPFSYDALFNANIGLANRMRKKYGEMSPNPFTSEEHQTFYQYTVTIDLDRISKIDVYLQKNGGITLNDGSWNVNDLKKIDGKLQLSLEKKQDKKEKQKEVEKREINVKYAFDVENLENAYVLRYSLDDDEKVRERIKNLVRAILNLKRSIKGRDEDLSPKLLVVGLYRDRPYKTFKDKIFLEDEYTEESYDEVEEKEEESKRVVRVKHVVSKSRKPIFRVDNKMECEEISEEKVLNFVEMLFQGDGELEKVKTFYDPSIEVRVG